jgi:transposase
VRHARRMPTQQAALKLVRAGHSYQEAGQRLGVPAGLVYLAATGVPTDSSDGLSAEDMTRPGLLPAAQALSEPPTEAADRSAHVRAFLSARASADAQMQSAPGSQQQR